MKCVHIDISCYQRLFLPAELIIRQTSGVMDGDDGRRPRILQAGPGEETGYCVFNNNR